MDARGSFAVSMELIRGKQPGRELIRAVAEGRQPMTRQSDCVPGRGSSKET